jgi:hypothetical protein
LVIGQHAGVGVVPEAAKKCRRTFDVREEKGQCLNPRIVRDLILRRSKCQEMKPNSTTSGQLVHLPRVPGSSTFLITRVWGSKVIHT